MRRPETVASAGRREPPRAFTSRAHATAGLRTGLAVLLAALIAPAPASSEYDIAGLADLSLEQLGDILVTSVSRRTERLADAPASIFVIRGEDIRRTGATSLPEALRLAPNLDVARADANQYAISARGFNSVLANKLLVMIDGRTVYSPLFSGVFWEAQSVLLDDVERIEVISGPGGTMWGTNAVNGVINVITRSPAQTQGTLVSLGAGNLDQTAAARYGGEFSGGGHFRIYAEHSARADTERADGSSLRDEADRYQAGFRADWSRGRDAFTLQGDSYLADIEQPSDTRDIGGANLLARWTRQLGHGSEAALQVYFDRSTRDHPGVFQETLHTWDISFQHSAPLATRHRLVWGAGYRYARDDTENSDVLAFLPPERTLRWANLFVQDQIVLRDDLDLTLGVKMENNVYTGTEWLPNAALAWRFASDRVLWGAVSRAVRAPSRIDREYFLPGSGLRGGTGFESELADTVELGYRAQPLPALSYSLTLFRSDYERLRTVEAVPGGTRFGNGAEATIQGLETWGSYRVTRDWRLMVGGTWLDQKRRLTSDSTHTGSLSPSLGNDPRHWWSIRSSFDVTPRHSLDFSIRRVGSRPDPHVPAYTAVDARAAWLPQRGLEISLTLQNLFDPRHPEWGPEVNRAELERGVYLKAVWQL